MRAKNTWKRFGCNGFGMDSVWGAAWEIITEWKGARQKKLCISFIVYIFQRRIRFFFLVAINAVYIVISGDRLWAYTRTRTRTNAYTLTQADFLCVLTACKLLQSQMGCSAFTFSFCRTLAHTQFRWAATVHAAHLLPSHFRRVPWRTICVKWNDLQSNWVYSLC